MISKLFLIIPFNNASFYIFLYYALKREKHTSTFIKAFSLLRLFLKRTGGKRQADIEKGLPRGNPLSVVIPRWQPLQEQGEQLADQNTEGDLTKNF